MSDKSNPDLEKYRRRRLKPRRKQPGEIKLEYVSPHKPLEPVQQDEDTIMPHEHDMAPQQMVEDDIVAAEHQLKLKKEELASLTAGRIKPLLPHRTREKIIEEIIKLEWEIETFKERLQN